MNAVRRLAITGLVQGVGYRDWLVRRARQLGLEGWVRNRADGSVEAVARGSETALDQLVALARRGPPLAQVTQVLVKDGQLPMEHTGFVRMPTE